MLTLVALVAFLVQLYSIGYLSDEPARALGRYYTYQSLFAFSMMGLVLAPNFLQLFMCWELVGLCSYLLIGFWYQKPEAARAALKAFWITKAGDVGLLIGIVLLWRRAGTFDFLELQDARRERRAPDGRPRDRDLLHLPRRRWKVGAVSTPRVAARRDGGADARVGVDPCGHDGDRRRLPAAAHRLALRAHPGRAAHRRLGRGVHGAPRRGAGVRAERHQARARVLHRVAARLHDDGDRRRLLGGRILPPAHARPLQGAAVPRRRRGHSCGAQQRPVAHGRAGAAHAPDRDRVSRRHAVACRASAVRRVPVEGGDPGRRLGAAASSGRSRC